MKEKIQIDKDLLAVSAKYFLPDEQEEYKIKKILLIGENWKGCKDYDDFETRTPVLKEPK